MLKTLCLLLLLMCSAQTAQAFQQNNIHLDLSVLVEKPNYYPAEPVQVSWLLYNKENEPIKVLNTSNMIFYRKIDSKFVPYRTARSLSGPYMSSIFTEIEIPPDKNMSNEQTILYNFYTKQFVLDSPGTYEFKINMTVKFADGKQQEYSSQTTQITVDEPQGKDKLALKALKKYQLGYFLSGFDNFTYDDPKEFIEKAALFIEEYQNTLYTPLVSRELKSNLNKIKQE